MRVNKIVEVDKSKTLIVALASTGNLAPLQNIPDLEVEEIKAGLEFGSDIDQSTQVCGTDIDLTMQTLKNAFAAPLVSIPPLIELPQPTTPGLSKPNKVFFNSKAFKNFSDTPIPEHIAILVSMGPKYSVPVYYKKEDFDNLKDAAININKIHGEVLDDDTVRESIIQHIKDYQECQYEQHCSEIRDFFHKTLADTKKFFKENPNIIVTQADKANCTIIMDKDVYINKIENLLKNTDTYVHLQSSSTPAYVIMNHKILDRLVKVKWIDQSTANRNKTQEKRTANMYALIKTHKQGEPPRPIVNTRGSMGYLAANTLVERLNIAKENGKYNVLNSKEAVDLINNTTICPDEHFYSFDVISMFTNITVERAITAVKKRQRALNFSNEEMTLAIDIIKFVCSCSTEITFNNQTHKQIKGLRMGSSLSPVLADFVMEDLLDTALIHINKPVIFMKYVDDILIAATEEDAQQMFKALNDADKDIKFEMESEQKTTNSINYLDFTIYNKPFDITTKWFQKHIASGRFLNQLSHHNQSQITNTAISFVRTMIGNTSKEYRQEVLDRAKHLLKINSYSNIAIERIIHKAQTTEQNNTNQKTEPKPYGHSIPYIPKLSDKITKELEANSTHRTPTRPQYKLSQKIFNPSKKAATNEPTADRISIIDNLDLTQ